MLHADGRIVNVGEVLHVAGYVAEGNCLVGGCDGRGGKELEEDGEEAVGE